MEKLSLPQQFENFADARKNGFINAMKVKEAGGKIAGTFCTFTPVEIMDAAGVCPVSLCGMSEEAIPEAEADLPKNICPLVKASYGFAITDKCPYFYFSDLVVAETTCDAKKKMYELLGKIKHTHVMQLPQTIDDAFSYKLWYHEIEKLIQVLEDKFQVKITDEKLRKAAESRNELRKLYDDLFNLGKLNPPAISGYQMYKAREAGGFSFDIEEHKEKIRNLIHDITESYESGQRPVPSNAKRILVTGCPIGGVIDKTVKVIEENGGVVVCFENCGGVKPNRTRINLDHDNIIEAIGNHYLNIGCSVISPNPKRVELMKQLIPEFQIDGVVDITLQACHTFNIETKVMKAVVNEAGIPYMALETDYSKSDSGQLATRLSAFIEML